MRTLASRCSESLSDRRPDLGLTYERCCPTCPENQAVGRVRPFGIPRMWDTDTHVQLPLLAEAGLINVSLVEALVRPHPVQLTFVYYEL